jgi:hypothetical protein
MPKEMGFRPQTPHSKESTGALLRGRTWFIAALLSLCTRRPPRCSPADLGRLEGCLLRVFGLTDAEAYGSGSLSIDPKRLSQFAGVSDAV